MAKCVTCYLPIGDKSHGTCQCANPSPAAPRAAVAAKKGAPKRISVRSVTRRWSRALGGWRDGRWVSPSADEIEAELDAGGFT